MQTTLNVFKSGGEHMRPCYQLLFFLAHQILGIVGSQIRIEKNFFPDCDIDKFEKM
jgi:hypothetical protein